MFIMPRMVDYPRRSLAQSLELADAVDQLGGSSSEEMAAKRLGRSGTKSGAFSALVGATVKFGLIDVRKSVLSTTARYRDYKLAYDEDQRVQALRGAFLNVPLFQRVYDRFAGKTVPVDILDKLLIREFDVPEVLAARVAEYFVEGARSTRLLSEAGVLNADAQVVTNSGQAMLEQKVAPDTPSVELAAPTANYVVRVTGPGITTTIEIFGEEDLVVVDAVLSRIRRALKSLTSSSL